MVTEVDQYGVERNRQLSSSSMKLLVMSAPTMVDASTAGPRPSASPITGIVITTFPKYMMKIPRGPHRGKIATDRMTVRTTPLEPMGKSQNPKWKTTPGNVPIPSQIHQLASLLHNILLSDREYNAPILEKLETPPTDPNANPIQLFSAIDLAHVDSHLSFTSQTLAQHAQKPELDDISEISD